MSDADVLPEGGGAPLPPKRPTVIRPAQDGRGPVPARPAPARPAPRPPGPRPPSVASAPAAGAAGPAPSPVPPRPSVPVSAPTSAKQSDRVAKSSSSKSKSQSSVRKRPEITIVDARPMSQAGFREMKGSEPPAPISITKPAAASAKEEKPVRHPTSNGGPPAIPSHPPLASSTTPHSTPPPSHSPPPIPSSRPSAPPSLPPPHPEKPAAVQDHQETHNSGPPVKPTRPTILRPARPKSAIIPGELPSEESPTSPPPLPKRSPIVSETAPGDLIEFNPPPKPARLCQQNEESQEEEKAAEGGEKGEGKIPPKKPTRVSIIRPPRRPKSMINTAPEDKDEPTEELSQHPPRPKLPPPASRPTTTVSAAPKDSSEADSSQSGDVEQTRTAVPPVPAARPRGSPRERPQEESTTDTSPVASPRTAPQNNFAGQNTKLSPHTDMDKAQGAPDRPKPPVPVSRPHGPPPGVPNAAGSPRLSQKMVPSKPSPPSVADPGPTSLSSGSTKGGGLVPPLVPSRPPAAAATVPDAEGSLYAVSEPLEVTDTFTKLSPPSESQPSRPPPPIPKSRPKSTAQSSSMLGRPLPSVPVESSGDVPSLGPAHCYEDVDTVRAQAQNSVRAAPTDLPIEQHSESLKESAEGADEAQQEVDLSAMYAKVNKPSKPMKPQNSQPGTDPSVSVASHPFGISLKHITSEDSPESEAPPIPPKLGSDDTDALSPPALSPKPSVSAKPQIAAKPKSPRKEEIPEEPAEASTKAELSEQSKPPLAAKRPTIIRHPKPAPRSESVASSSGTEDATDVQIREKGGQNVHRPQLELSGNGENQVSAAERPVPPRRPVTIIGLPHQNQKLLDAEVGEGDPSPLPVQRQQISEGPPSGAEKSEVNEAVHEGQDTTHPPLHTSPALSRPPPPRPGRPCKPELSSPSLRKKTDSEPPAPPKPPSPAPPCPSTQLAPVSAISGGEEGGDTRPTPVRSAEDGEEGRTVPGRPPSPAPPRPPTRPAPVTVTSGGEEREVAVMETSSIKSSPPVERREESPVAEEAVDRRPRQAGRPPPRPMSMPPVKPPLSATTALPLTASGTTEPKHEKPSRPQPVRPAPPKHSQTTTPPPLPHRPGLSHPLYSYMAAQPHAIALHSYPARQADELPFQEGDTVVLLKRVDEQWLMGKVGDKEGIFPQNFVNIIHPLHDELPSSAIDDVIDSIFEDALQEKPDLLQGPRCRARFDFEGEGQGDLAFDDGDVIQLIARCGEDWLKGELNGKVGMFPASFVEIIEDLPEETERTKRMEGGQLEVTALFDFSGQEGELSFEAGDRITIMSRVNERWLFGQSGGKQGSFPATFVDSVPHDLPQHTPQAAAHSSPSAGPPSSHPTAAARPQNKPEQWCTALYSFGKAQEGDLEFTEGDRILIVEQVGQEWLRGRLGDKEGVFPASFVQMDSGKGMEPEDHSTGLSTHTALVVGRALFDFEGQNDNELSFKAHDEIVLGSRVSEGSEWQWGELNGKKGMFPADFVEVL